MMLSTVTFGFLFGLHACLVMVGFLWVLDLLIVKNRCFSSALHMVFLWHEEHSSRGIGSWNLLQQFWMRKKIRERERERESMG